MESAFVAISIAAYHLRVSFPTKHVVPDVRLFARKRGSTVALMNQSFSLVNVNASPTKDTIDVLDARLKLLRARYAAVGFYSVVVVSPNFMCDPLSKMLK